MSEEQSIDHNKHSLNQSHDGATQKAEEAAQAKAEELRTAAQSKCEQGKSTLGHLPADEDTDSSGSNAY
jgi:hypothetical protein